MKKLFGLNYFSEGVPTELLAALQKCEEQLSIDYPGASCEKFPTIARILEEARAAIKKAMGK